MAFQNSENLCGVVNSNPFCYCQVDINDNLVMGCSNNVLPKNFEWDLDTKITNNSSKFSRFTFDPSICGSEPKVVPEIGLSEDSLSAIIDDSQINLLNEFNPTAKLVTSRVHETNYFLQKTSKSHFRARQLPDRLMLESHTSSCWVIIDNDVAFSPFKNLIDDLGFTDLLNHLPLKSQNINNMNTVSCDSSFIPVLGEFVSAVEKSFQNPKLEITESNRRILSHFKHTFSSLVDDPFPALTFKGEFLWRELCPENSLSSISQRIEDQCISIENDETKSCQPLNNFADLSKFHPHMNDDEENNGRGSRVITNSIVIVGLAFAIIF
eukprot:Awhi_evm2s1023